MDSESEADVSGPLAMIPIPFLGISVTSSRINSILGSPEITSVTREANRSRSTASAEPAGTRTEYATSIRIEPSLRSSSFNNHEALYG